MREYDTHRVGEVHRTVNKKLQRQTTQNQQRNQTENIYNEEMNDEEYADSDGSLCIGYDLLGEDHGHPVDDYSLCPMLKVDGVFGPLQGRDYEDSLDRHGNA